MRRANRYGILGIILLLCSMTCQGDTLYLGLWSNHNGPCSECDSGDWNETHNLIGYARDDLFIAYMRNSYNKDAFMVGKTYSYNYNNNIRPYITLGVTTGYADYIRTSVGPFSFAGFMGIELHTQDEKYGVIIAGVPGEVISIGFKFKL